MLFWILAALLTLAASLAVMLPLARRSGQATRPQDNDIEVYRDQLHEVERDAERGLIGVSDAEEAKAEIGRRILRLADKSKLEPVSNENAASSVSSVLAMKKTTEARRRAATARVIGAAAVLSIPLVSWGLYGELGSPQLPAEPLIARLKEDPANSSVEELVARAEAHLTSNPDDGRGWDVLAPIYLRGGRLADSVTAYRNAIRLLGETGDRVAGLGEAIASTADGLVTSDARAAFRRAIEIEPANPKARFYLATALAQEGKFEEAAAGWKQMNANLPEQSPWRPAVQQALAEVGRMAAGGATPAPNPTQEQINSASSMSAADRTAMIEQMVTSLDARLRENPRDPEGWMRLVRSYAVLGKPQAARDALARGLQALEKGSEDGKRLSALAASLGLTATE
jgi:cytochrome c-type biogenesis protein CcmH